MAIRIRSDSNGGGNSRRNNSNPRYLARRTLVLVPLFQSLFSYLPVSSASLFTMDLQNLSLVGCSDQSCAHGDCREVQFDTGITYSCHCYAEWEGVHCDQPQQPPTPSDNANDVIVPRSLRRNLKKGATQRSKSKTTSHTSPKQKSVASAKSKKSKSNHNMANFSKCIGKEKDSKGAKSSKGSRGCGSSPVPSKSANTHTHTSNPSVKESKSSNGKLRSSKTSSISTNKDSELFTPDNKHGSTLPSTDDDWEVDEDEEEDEDDKKVMFVMGGNRIEGSHTVTNDYKIESGRRTEAQRDELRNCVRWAVGLEHESMLVHRHPDSLEEYAIDANKVLREMARYGKIYNLTKMQHAIAVKANDDGAEFSGRRCSGSIDLVFKTMMESVTTDARELTFDGAYQQLELIDETFLEMANRHPFIQKAIKDLGLGPVTRPAAGMSNQLGMYQRTSGNWFSFASCDDNAQRQLKDYTGSYHISISLPFTPQGWIAREESILLNRDTCASTTTANLRGGSLSWLYSSASSLALRQQEEWIAAHQNLANMVQWIEPLLVSVFGSADADAVCDAGVYTEGSFRSMETGWGVPGSTDVRTFKDSGIGRYIKKDFEWMFPDESVDFPSAYRDKLSGCMSDGMGADIRTKTTVNEHHWPNDKTLPRMDVGQGIEIRIFDNFPIEHVPQVYRMLVFVAEAGRHFTAPEYIYDNKDWIGAIQSVMREGWNAALPQGYVHSMARALNLPLSFAADLENFQAFHVYSKLYQSLWNQHSTGMWSNLMLDDLPEEFPTLPNPNRQSWEHGAIIKGFTPHVLLEKLGIKFATLPRTVVATDIDWPHDDSCSEDHDDLIYLAETFGLVSEIVLSVDGKIKSFFLQNSGQWGQTFNQLPTCRSHDEAS